jgi:hypothetical protein
MPRPKCFEPWPYYTDSTEYAPEQCEIYHMRADCPDGKKIEQMHRKFGGGGKQLCKKCQTLDAPVDGRSSNVFAV